MLKRAYLVLAVFGILAGTVSAQSEERAKNNRVVQQPTGLSNKSNISLSFAGLGAGLSYERMFSSHLSVVADVSYTIMLVIDEFTATVKGRWYPFDNVFYLDLGLGYSYGKGYAGLIADYAINWLVYIFTFGMYSDQKDSSNDLFRNGGFLVQPGLGWKIDIGKPDSFVLPISMGVDIKLGNALTDFMPFFRMGLGYSF